MAGKIATNELRATWESAAPGWAKWEEAISRNLVDVTETMLDLAGVASGMYVLDLACGAGSQTLQAAKRVGESGRVVACDISDEMLNHVRDNAERCGLNNVETLRSAAEELTGAELSFDASISRFGLMLFASPQNAVSAVQRVLKPGSRFAALVFTTPDKNPYFAQTMAILLRHGGKQPPQPGQPGLFALGGVGLLEGLLSDCGFVAIKMINVRVPFRLSSADDALAFLQQAAGAYRAVIADLSDDAKTKAWAEVRDCLGQFEDETGFETELDVLIGSGSIPA